MPDSLVRTSESLYRNPVTGVYYAHFRAAGKQIKRSLKTSDFATAKSKLSALKNKYASVQKVGGRKLFKDVAALWLESRLASPAKLNTVKNYKDLVKRVNSILGDMEVRKIDTAAIDEYRKHRADVSPRARNAELQMLLRVLKYAADVLGIITEGKLQVSFEKQHKKQLRMPTREQFANLLAEMRRETKAEEGANLVEFLGLTGCRLEEGSQVEWKDIDWERNILTITGGLEGTKNHEWRFIPIPVNRPLRNFLESLKEKAGNNPVGNLFNVKSARRAMNTAAKRASIPHFSHHDLRHFFCSNAIEKGVDLKTISEWLGHKDGGALVMSTYGHLRQEHSLKMAELL